NQKFRPAQEIEWSCVGEFCIVPLGDSGQRPRWDNPVTRERSLHQQHEDRLELYIYINAMTKWCVYLLPSASDYESNPLALESVRTTLEFNSFSRIHVFHFQPG